MPLNNSCKSKHISILKCKRHYGSCLLMHVVEKVIENEFSLTVGKFYIYVL